MRLKPCPFCGRTPVIHHAHDSLFDSGVFAYYLVCPKCGVRTQKSRKLADAFETWNARVSVIAGSGSARLETYTTGGHWVQISPAGIFECSECGKTVMTNDIDAYKYCHGCGAKMEKVGDS